MSIALTVTGQTRFRANENAICAVSLGVIRTGMPAVFYQTATTGRTTKGMPSWKGILKDEELWTIFTFLKTVQKK